MSYGEATLAEMLEAHKELLTESETLLGAVVMHIGPATHTVTRDRLGGTKEIVKNAEPVPISGGSVVFSPSEEELKRVGIQERVDAVMTLKAENLPETFNKVDSRFIISTSWQKAQEYKIKVCHGLGQVGSEFVYLVIGLVTK